MASDNKKHSFKAILQNPNKKADIAYIIFPFDVEKLYGTKGQVKVKATFDGHSYRGVLANMGGNCHIIGVRKDIREAIGKNPGELVTVTIEKDTEERIVEVPAELQVIFKRNVRAKSFFDTLSFTNRKEYVVWFNSAKKPETKEKRLKEIPAKLLAGKKNPSEK